MKIALISGASVHRVWTLPAGATELAIRYALPNGNQLSPVCLGWSKGGYAVVEVTEFTIPEGKQRAGEASYEISNGVVVESYEVEDIPPQPMPDRVTARQFKLALLAADLLDDVETFIASQPRAVQIAFENSGTFVRDEPMMQVGFAALGFTEEQVDAFFMQASEL